MALNIDQLGRLVAAKRGTQGVRAAAKEIGISPATLSRIENGHVPDLATFAQVCRWLDEDPAQFLGMQPMPERTQSVQVHLRKKNTTSLETATALGQLIVAAQQALKDRNEL